MSTTYEVTVFVTGHLSKRVDADGPDEAVDEVTFDNDEVAALLDGGTWEAREVDD